MADPARDDDTSGPRIRAISVAAAVLVLGAGGWVTYQLTRDADPVSAPAAPTPSPTHDKAPSPTPSGESTHARSEGVDIEQVEPALLDWIEALSEGDTPTAWAMLAERTKLHYDKNVDDFAADGSALAEGFGAWHNVGEPPAMDVRVLVSGGNEAAGVVTLYGPIRREGGSGWDANALAFRVLGSDVFFDPFSSDLKITPIEPRFNEGYAADRLPKRFRAKMSHHTVQANFFVSGMKSSGRDATLGVLLRKVGRDTWLAMAPPPDSIDPGPAAVTIAAIDAKGGISVVAVPIVVVPR